MPYTARRTCPESEGSYPLGTPTVRKQCPSLLVDDAGMKRRVLVYIPDELRFENSVTDDMGQRQLLDKVSMLDDSG